MKSIAVCGLAAVLLLGAPAARAAEAAPAFVFIDLDKVFKEFHKTKAADADLKKQADEFKAERKKLVDDYRKLQDEFNDVRDEAQNSALSDEARSQKRTAAEEKMVQMREEESKIRRFDDGKQKQLDEQSKRMRKRIVEEIRQKLDAYARGKGYSVIMDASGETLNGEPVVLFSDGKFDVTADVIKLLNAGQ
jgi:outer membrane protein